MLAHLYHDLHQVVYRGSSSLSCGVTVLQIWAWEHLAVTRPACPRVRPPGMPYIYMYAMFLTQPKLGKVDYWRRLLDDMDIVVWRLYLDCKPWNTDDIEMPYVCILRFLIGKTPFILERFLALQVQRQFGFTQGMP